MSNLDFIYKRQSVRRFKNEDVPVQDIKEMIKAATYAPSGHNVQNWHFIVIKNKEKIEEIAKIVEKKHIEIANYAKEEEKTKAFMKFLKYYTVFKNAPVLVLVYVGPYPTMTLDLLKEHGVSSEEIHSYLKPAPAIQNIGASIENLLLAAANMGYGACWMTGPIHARKEIEEFIKFEKEGYSLATMIPLGIPEGEIKSPPRKPVDEVLTIVE